MSTQAESVAKLRQSLNDAEKQLQALLERREMCKSTLVKLDAEERALSKKLQESKDKFRALVAASAPPPQAAAPAAKPPPPTGILESVAQFENLADELPDVGIVPIAAPPPGTEPRKVSGPETEDTYAIDDIVAVRTVSTYPMLPGGQKRVCRNHTHARTGTAPDTQLWALENSKGRRSATSTTSRCCQRGRSCAWRTGATGASGHAMQRASPP